MSKTNDFTMVDVNRDPRQGGDGVWATIFSALADLKDPNTGDQVIQTFNFFSDQKSIRKFKIICCFCFLNKYDPIS